MGRSVRIAIQAYDDTEQTMKEGLFLDLRDANIISRSGESKENRFIGHIPGYHHSEKPPVSNRKRTSDWWGWKQKVMQDYDRGQRWSMAGGDDRKNSKNSLVVLTTDPDCTLSRDEIVNQMLQERKGSSRTPDIGDRLFKFFLMSLLKNPDGKVSRIFFPTIHLPVFGFSFGSCIISAIANWAVLDWHPVLLQRPSSRSYLDRSSSKPPSVKRYVNYSHFRRRTSQWFKLFCQKSMSFGVRVRRNLRAGV